MKNLVFIFFFSIQLTYGQTETFNRVGGFDFIKFEPIQKDTTSYYFDLFYGEEGTITKIRRYDKSREFFNLEFQTLAQEENWISMSVVLYYGAHDDKSEAIPLRGILYLDKKEERLIYLALKYIPNEIATKESRVTNNKPIAVFELDSNLFPIKKIDSNLVNGFYLTKFIYSDTGSLIKEQLVSFDSNFDIKEGMFNKAKILGLFQISAFNIPIANLHPDRKELNIPMWVIYPYQYN